MDNKKEDRERLDVNQEQRKEKSKIIVSIRYVRCVTELSTGIEEYINKIKIHHVVMHCNSLENIAFFLQYFCYIEYLFFAAVRIKIEYPLGNVILFGFSDSYQLIKNRLLENEVLGIKVFAFDYIIFQNDS